MVKQTNRIRPLVAVTVTLALLGGMSFDVFSRPSAADSEPYHAKVAVLGNAIPMNVGQWEGSDRPATSAAIKLLKPNFILNRLYINRAENEAVSLLVVQTRDARDMLGHYPPVCYPAHGWSKGDHEPYSVTVDGIKLNGEYYKFNRRKFTGVSSLHVVDLILLPNGTSVGSMDEVRTFASDYRYRHYGAAQIQFVFHTIVDEPRRDEIVRKLLRPNLSLVRQLLAAPAEAEME